MRYLSLVLILVYFHATADEVRIVTWNVKDIFQVSDVQARANDFDQAGSTLQPDILIIQEITSQAEAEAIADAMGLFRYYVTTSEFVGGDSDTRSGFEVGVISKFPIAESVEFDPSPGGNGAGEPLEVPLRTLSEFGVPNDGTARGVLWVRIDEPKILINAVHLKSSVGRVGNSDLANARKRERVVAAIAEQVHYDSAKFSDYAIVVAGDFNVGHSDPAKVGTNLGNDCASGCGPGDDGYDDTHALLGGGLIYGLQMVNLALPITTTTFPGFAGTPIDNIYVDALHAGQFTNAVKSSSTFSSDHTPLTTTYTSP